MKTKIVSLLLTPTIAAAFASNLVASATTKVNNLSVVYETVKVPVSIADGTSVPVGATAISFQIQNNAGFEISEINFSLGKQLLCDTSGNPIVSVGSVLEGSTIAVAQKGENIAMSAVTTDTCDSDGTLATIYISDPVSVDILSSSFQQVNSISFDTISSNNNETASTSSEPITFTLGDVNGDGKIDTNDAYIVRKAISIGDERGALKQYGSTSYYYLHVALEAIPYNLIYGFSRKRYAVAADGDENYLLFDCDEQVLSDAYQILNYYCSTN